MKLFESFETRVLFSGNVAVKITDSQVRFIGDAAANALSIIYSRTDKQLLVTGSNGTTIDGRLSRTYAARDNIAVSLGDGDDVVSLQRFSGGFNVGVDLGAGNDAVYFKRSNILAADFFGGTGNDTLDITDSTFSRRLRAFPGEQDDVTALRNVRARAGLDVTDTAGNTVVAMDQVSASGTSWFSGSNRQDVLEITRSDLAAFSAKLRGGNDAVYVRMTRFAGDSPIDGGTGSNKIDREVFAVYDFAAGAPHGWMPQLSGRDPSLYGQPVTAEEFAEKVDGTFGIAPIDPDTGLSGSTYELSYRSVVFLTKQMGASDGIAANQSYDVEIEARMVVAGDGGNSRYEAGVVPVRPDISGVELSGVEEDGGTVIIGGKKYALPAAGDNDYSKGALTTPTADGTLVQRVSNPATVTVGASGDAWVVFQLYYGEIGPVSEQFRSLTLKLTPTSN